jgi:LEA14-like dessication related protein
MNPTAKKIVIVGVAGISLFLLYQLYKFNQYKLKISKVRILKLNPSILRMELFASFDNKSSLKIDILEQDHTVYINNKFVSTIKNYTKTTILPKTQSVMPVLVELNPSKLMNIIKRNFLDIVSNPESIKIKVKSVMKVSFYGIKIPIKSTYEENLNNLLNQKSANVEK